MTVYDVLAFSPWFEQGLVAIVLLAVVALGIAAVVRPIRARAPVVLGRTELAWLGVILTAAAFTRLVGARTWLTAPFSFSELTPLFVADMIDRGVLWHEVLARFTEYQAGSIDKSATVLPVAAALQLLLGPSLHLPVLVGALYGVASVLFAWLLGRTAAGPAFGLVFAALVAASPLQLVWSRLGGIHGTSVTHVLLTLWLARLAGKRRSVVLAVVAGILVWATLYQYYAARIAIPVAFAFLVAGLRHGRASIVRAACVLAVTVLTVAGVYAAARPPGLKQTLWPSFTGYVGSRGERTLGDILQQSVEPIVRETPTALRRYFREERAVPEPESPAIRWGMQMGGLCLVPIALLGVVGCLRALVRWRSEWPWLLFAAAGLAVPALSVTTARRFVVFDAAWCALAASGLLAILHSPLCRALSTRGLVVLCAGVLALTTGWAFATVVVLHGTLSPAHFQAIPFGESGLGDGLTCRRCMEVAWRVRDDVAHDRMVVLFDTDLMRENATIPGGLTWYPRLAALEAGHPTSILDFYPIMADRPVAPFEHERYFNPATATFGGYLAARIERAHPHAIVWHFERPTQWERWLAERLTRAGGELETFPSALSVVPAMRVTTPWDAREGAFAVLREIATTTKPDRAQCVTLEQTAFAVRPYPIMAVAGTTDVPPRWAVGSWAKVALGDFEADVPLAVGLGVAADGRRLDALDQTGAAIAFELPSGLATTRPRALPDVGLNCAVPVGSAWWAVDPTTGGIRTDDDARVPAGDRWFGITRDGDGRAVLAAADQQLVVVDATTGGEVLRFPAVVSPSRRALVGECALVAASGEWYATGNPITSWVTLYDRGGRELGAVDAAALHPTMGPLSAIAASGPYLAIAQGGGVTTARVRIAPECLSAPDASAAVRDQAVPSTRPSSEAASGSATAQTSAIAKKPAAPTRP